MSATGEAQLGLEHHNSEQSINRLPFEVLSCIFALGRQKPSKPINEEKPSFGELVVVSVRSHIDNKIFTPVRFSKSAVIGELLLLTRLCCGHI
ncbi:hypothetical protein BDV93DRAFT_341953 [Ceratobasidium sp. AG-I]|nr:hypothetical protein BDV93DRAFT_341953 [Ceratobasidium sp. AG-I]